MPDHHDRMLQSWRENAARKQDVNFRFLRSLKMVSDPDGIDALAGELHKEVFSLMHHLRGEARGVSGLPAHGQGGVHPESLSPCREHIVLSRDISYRQWTAAVSPASVRRSLSSSRTGLPAVSSSFLRAAHEQGSSAPVVRVYPSW
jgi:hypothetical protein